MKRLLVTGASGFLGYNICSIASGPWDVFGTTFNHNSHVPQTKTLKVDLREYQKLKTILNEIKPDAVIHSAAAARPDYCQDHERESLRINVNVTENIAGLCADRQISFTFISSDQVFDGLAAPYCETDQVCPINTYGEHKALAEDRVFRTTPFATVCRMPLMFGLNGVSFLSVLLAALKNGDRLRLFVDEIRTPISAHTAARGILWFLGRVTGVVHLGGNQRISRFDFARMICSILEINDAKLIPVLLEEYRHKAPRPPDLSLDSRLARDLGFSAPSLRDELKELFDIET